MDLSKFERFVKTFEQGSIICCEHEPGNAFYLLQEGRAGVVKFDKGNEQIVDFLQPGEIFGEMAILENAPRSATIVALDTVKALEFNKDNFEVILQGNPQISMKILKLFCRRIYDQKRHMQTLLLKSSQARVADVFLMLNENRNMGKLDGENAKNVENSMEFDITAEQVAQRACLPLEECQKILNGFVKQSKLTVYKDRIVVNNVIELKRMVNRALSVATAEG